MSRRHRSVEGAEVHAFDERDYPEPELTGKIIGCGIQVHRELGAGYVEKIYERSLKHELGKQGLRCDSQRTVKVYYDGVEVGEHDADLVVEDKVVLELKTVEVILDKHVSQLISTMKALRIPLGLQMNFNEAKLVDGIRRVVLSGWRQGGGQDA